MATIERIGKSPIQVFEGLTVDSIENEHKYLVNKHFVTPIKAELNSFEYDRTFNNVDILEGNNNSIASLPIFTNIISSI